MAIEKPITMNNGVVLSYHRIFTMNIVVNREILIEITSYLSKKERDKEKEVYSFYKNATNEELHLMDSNNSPTYNGYTYTEFVSVPYDETFSIVKAYDYIKTLPKFEGAVDVFE